MELTELTLHNKKQNVLIEHGQKYGTIQNKQSQHCLHHIPTMFWIISRVTVSVANRNIILFVN